MKLIEYNYNIAVFAVLDQIFEENLGVAVFLWKLRMKSNAGDPKYFCPTK